jgi:hypothetical protein
MLAIRTGRIEFASGTGSRTASQMVWFPNQVIRECHVGLAGYSVSYSSGDHELKTIEVGLSCSLQKTEFGIGVQVTATLFLCDKNADDAFQGRVDFVLFAELDQPLVLNPRVLDLRVVLQ